MRFAYPASCVFLFGLLLTSNTLSKAPGQAGGAPAPEIPSSALIVPGRSVGPLSLGASRDAVQHVFPFKREMDQETTYSEPQSCGSPTWINWLDFDAKADKMNGNVFVYLRGGRVFQIESSTPKFRTADGITIGTPPEVVQSKYKGMETYLLMYSSSLAEGGEDLIYWVDREKGIAFSFSYNPQAMRRTLFQVIVFSPGTPYQPEGCAPSADEWIKLPAYYLGSPGKMPKGHSH